MRSLAVAVRRWAGVVSIALTGVAVASLAVGQTVEVALNVRYNVAGDPDSGGTWRLVAKASDTTVGIAGVNVRFTSQSILGNPSPVGPIGRVNGTHDAGFSIFETMSVGDEKWIILGQSARLQPLGAGQEQSIFYGAGTLANGAPNYPGKPNDANFIGPAFSTLTNTARIPWATALDSLGESAWSTAVGLATGSFAAGSTPGIIGGSANIYTSQGSSSIAGMTATVSGTSFIVQPLRIVAGIGGDYNGNGIVDAADYTVWRNHLGQVFQLTNEGPDTPGEVTSADYDFWKANFGLGSPGAGGGSASGGPGSLPVPEPGTLALLLGAVGMLLCGRKQGHFRTFSAL